MDSSGGREVGDLHGFQGERREVNRHENNCGTLLRFYEFQDPNVELILK